MKITNSEANIKNRMKTKIVDFKDLIETNQRGRSRN